MSFDGGDGREVSLHTELGSSAVGGEIRGFADVPSAGDVTVVVMDRGTLCSPVVEGRVVSDGRGVVGREGLADLLYGAGGTAGPVRFKRLGFCWEW